MYTILKETKGIAFPQVQEKHFFASSFPSSNSTLHFSYTLIDLQKEIEKRTFYMGKYRAAEGAQHLLDLIGMSRDEGDLLYPFAKSAMADVFDQLNKSSLHIPKVYEWKEPADPIEVRTLYPLNTVTPAITPTISSDKKHITLTGTISDTGLSNGDAIDASLYRLSIAVNVVVNTKYEILGSGVTVTPTKTVSLTIPADNIRSIGNNKWQIIPIEVPIHLDAQSNFTSAEIIESISSIDYVTDSAKLQLIDPMDLRSGCIVSVNNVTYEILMDTNENDLDLATQAKQVDINETLVEGIHYYFSVPNFINMSSVAPLDTSILEALVLRIIWKWLLLAYPTEAANYDALYQEEIKAISTRCNIFNKHWQKNPRIL